MALVNAIEDHREIEIEYLKLADNTMIRRRLQPYRLFPTIRDWRLVAKSDGIFKQFIVDNITAIKKVDHRFSPDKTFSLQNMFVHAWEIYRGKEPIVVKLLFSKEMSPIVMKKVWSENQMLETLPNGKVCLTVQIGDIEEMVGWVMSWGNGRGYGRWSQPN